MSETANQYRLRVRSWVYETISRDFSRAIKEYAPEYEPEYLDALRKEKESLRKAARTNFLVRAFLAGKDYLTVEPFSVTPINVREFERAVLDIEPRNPSITIAARLWAEDANERNLNNFYGKFGKTNGIPMPFVRAGYFYSIRKDPSFRAGYFEAIRKDPLFNVLGVRTGRTITGRDIDESRPPVQRLPY